MDKIGRGSDHPPKRFESDGVAAAKVRKRARGNQPQQIYSGGEDCKPNFCGEHVADTVGGDVHGMWKEGGGMESERRQQERETNSSFWQQQQQQEKEEEEVVVGHNGAITEVDLLSYHHPSFLPGKLPPPYPETVIIR